MRIYPRAFKSWILATRKLAKFNDRKRPHISNIGSFPIVEFHCFGAAKIQFLNALGYISMEKNRISEITGELAVRFNKLFLMSFLFFIVADAQAEVPLTKDGGCVDEMNFYAKVLGGANFLQDTTINGNKTAYHTGYVFSGSLGYCWRYYGLRVEAEYAFRRNAISKIHFYTQGSSEHGHFQTSSYMANLLWDLPLCAWGGGFWHIQPFIGAGLGYDFQRMHSSNSRIVFGQKWHRFSWQAMAGLAYPIFPNTEITVEYKFHEGGSHFYNHSVGVGLIYKFGFIR